MYTHIDPINTHIFVHTLIYLLYTHIYTTFIFYCIHILFSDYIVREIGFIQICVAEMIDNDYVKVIEMRESDAELENASSFFEKVYNPYIRRRVSFLMDGQYNNNVGNIEEKFQHHARTVYVKTILKDILNFIERKEGSKELKDLVDDYNGKVAINFNPNPSTPTPTPGPSKVAKRRAADVVESAADPNPKRSGTAPVEPDAAARPKKQPYKKPVSAPVIPASEPAAGARRRPVQPAAAAVSVISKSM